MTSPGDRGSLKLLRLCPFSHVVKLLIRKDRGFRAEETISITLWAFSNFGFSLSPKSLSIFNIYSHFPVTTGADFEFII
jgi:hypothetical protein